MEWKEGERRKKSSERHYGKGSGNVWYALGLWRWSAKSNVCVCDKTGMSLSSGAKCGRKGLIFQRNHSGLRYVFFTLKNPHAAISPQFPSATTLSSSFDNIIPSQCSPPLICIPLKSAWIHWRGTGGVGKVVVSLWTALSLIPGQCLIQLLGSGGQMFPDKRQPHLSGRRLAHHVSLSCQEAGERTEVWFRGPLAEALNGHVLCPGMFSHIIKQAARAPAEASHCIFNAAMSTVIFADSALSAGGYWFDGASVVRGQEFLGLLHSLCSYLLRCLRGKVI